MTTLTAAAKQTPKASRSIRRIDTETIRITCGRETAVYSFAELPCEIEDARAFRLITVGASYDVLLGRNGQDRQCECKGFLRWGHCKHCDGLTALLNREAA